MNALIRCIGVPELAFFSSSVIASLVDALDSDDLTDCLVRRANQWISQCSPMFPIMILG
jgi:hypothetical protein